LNIDSGTFIKSPQFQGVYYDLSFGRRPSRDSHSQGGYLIWRVLETCEKFQNDGGVCLAFAANLSE